MRQGPPVIVQVVTLLFCNLESYDPHTLLNNFTNDITSSHRRFSSGSKGVLGLLLILSY